MLAYFVTGLTAFVAAGLTLYSGFGLGTIFLPVFALFFPLDQAVALTAILHLGNNLFKLALLGWRADFRLVWRFGAPAVAGAFFGAGVLFRLVELPPLFTYWLGARQFTVQPVKFVIGLLLLVFSGLEMRSGGIRTSRLSGHLALGGLLSGFFGGLSGHQGALRSAFLVGLGLSPERFVATSVVIAVLVDFARLTVYGCHFYLSGLGPHGPILLVTLAAALSGTLLATRLLRKITLPLLHRVVMIGLMGIALGLILGLI